MVAMSPFFLPGHPSRAVPLFVSHQGYLSDSTGAPVNGTLPMTFSLYDGENGLIWSEVHTAVVVDSGVYTVQLGSVDESGNPLLPAYFDQELFLGIQIDDDPEMSPRQPLTSSPYSMRADVAASADSATHAAVADHATTAGDADTVDSVHAGDLEESSEIDADIATHTGLPGAHHIKTTLFTELTGQIALEQIPESIARDTELTWGNLSGIPAGFSDGVDNNTTYSSGTGIDLSGTTFSLQIPLVLSGSNSGPILSATNNGDGNALYGEATGSSGTGVYGKSNSFVGVRGESNSADHSGVFGTNTQGAGVRGVSVNHHGVIGRTDAGDMAAVKGWNTLGMGVEGRSDNGDGVVGWTGTSENSGVYGWSEDGVGVTGRCNGNNNGAFFSTFSTNADHAGVVGNNNGEGPGIRGKTASTSPWTPAIYGENLGDGDGVYGWSQNRYGVVGVSNSSNAAIWAKNNSTGPAVLAEGGTNGIAGDFRGRVKTEVLEITGGSDISEQFDIHNLKENVMPSPGMVVSIDSERPGNLIVSDRSYDRSVAGIISGAGGVRTGMLMGQNGTKADGAYPVALTGRVYAWVDASYGSVEPGDLLTSSDTPGHARKVADYSKARGAILGKAMSSLQEGRGLALVLVTLQ